MGRSANALDAFTGDERWVADLCNELIAEHDRTLTSRTSLDRITRRRVRRLYYAIRSERRTIRRSVKRKFRWPMGVPAGLSARLIVASACILVLGALTYVGWNPIAARSCSSESTHRAIQAVVQRPLVETRRTVPPNRRSHDFSISSKGTNINVACSTFIGADTPDLAFDGVTSFGESPRNRWACYNSGFRQDWIEWEFPEPQTLSGVVTHFFPMTEVRSHRRTMLCSIEKATFGHP